MNRQEIGSSTAKGGFDNEKAICQKFNNWREDLEAQKWLQIMGYKLASLDNVVASQIPVKINKNDLEIYKIQISEYENFLKFKKADAQIKIFIQIGNIIKIENISLKKANLKADFNQIDKRTVNSYQQMWGFNDEIAFWLKLFTGEILVVNCRESLGNLVFREANKRIYLDEFPEEVRRKTIKFFENNKILIVSDLLKGRGGLSADWILITRLNCEETSWILKDINTVMNFYGSGEICISPKGSLRIGKITMQRKGGTPDPTKLQFKFKPCELFELE